LKTYTTPTENGERIDYTSDATLKGRKRLNGNETPPEVTFTVPDDSYYIETSNTYMGTSMRPSVFTINSYDVLNGVIGI